MSGGVLTHQNLGNLGVAADSALVVGGNLLWKTPTNITTVGMVFRNLDTNTNTAISYASISSVMTNNQELGTQFALPRYWNGKFYLMGRRGYYFCDESNVTSWSAVPYPAPYDRVHATEAMFIIPAAVTFKEDAPYIIIGRGGTKIEMVEV